MESETEIKSLAGRLEELHREHGNAVASDSPREGPIWEELQRVDTRLGEALKATIQQEPPHKRYLVFQYEGYYPAGGLGDLTGSFDTIEVAELYAKRHPSEYNEIADRETLKVVRAVD